MGGKAWTEGEERLGPRNEYLGLEIGDQAEVRFKALNSPENLDQGEMG